MFNDTNQTEDSTLENQVSSPVVENEENNQLPSTTVDPIPKKKLNIGLVVGIVISALVLLGGGGFAAYYFMQPNHVEIIQDALLKTATASSRHFQIELSGAGDYGQSENAKIEADFVISSEGDVIQLAGNKANFSSDLQFTNSKGDYSFDLGFSIKNINDVLYVKVNTVPEIPLLPAEALSGITESWIKIDVAGLREQYGVDQMIDSYLEQKPELKALQEKDAVQQKIAVEAMKKYVFEDQVFTMEEVETLKGGSQEMYKYTFVLVEENVAVFLQHVGETIGETLTVEEIAKVLESLESIENTTVTLVVGADDHYIYESTIQTTITNNDVKGELNFAISFSDFNAVSEIVAPETSIDVQDFIANMMKPKAPTEIPEYISGLPNLLDDSDSDGLSDYDEIYFYNTNVYVADTDDDGFIDGEEVSNGYSPSGGGTLELMPNISGIFPKTECSNEFESVNLSLPDRDLLQYVFAREVSGSEGERFFIKTFDSEVSGSEPEKTFPTSISPDTKLLKMELRSSYLIIDLSSSFVNTPDCLESAKTQIARTAAQFESVEFVAITVNGELETIIQVKDYANDNGSTDMTDPFGLSEVQ